MMRVLFGFEGRIGRRNYLLAIICQVVIITAVIMLFWTAIVGLILGSVMVAEGAGFSPEMLMGADGEPDQGAVNAFVAAVGIPSLLFIVFIFGFSLYMSLAAQVKRLHDMNMSGWFTLLNFVPMPISATLLMSDPANGPIALFINLIPMGLGLACLFFPGTRGPNNFGEDRLSIFDMSARNDETWADRAQAHRAALRDQQVEQQEAAEEAKAPRQRRNRQAPSGGGSRKGFGKRGMA